MMMKSILTLFSLWICLAATAQVSENRNVQPFTKIKASLGIEVFYTVSDKTSLQLTADDPEKLAMIKTKSDGETLTLFVDTKGAEKSRKGGERTIDGVSFKILKVYVTGNALTDINVSTGASVTLENLNATENLKIEASSAGAVVGRFNCSELVVDSNSSGSINLNLQAKKVLLDASSASTITLEGKSLSARINASSASRVDTTKLEVADVIVEASSTAKASVTASKSLDANATSLASIYYYGNPMTTNIGKSSMGKIIKQ
jgi:hypothetical protein